MKKIIAMLLVFVMLFALSATAMAAGEGAGIQTMSFITAWRAVLSNKLNGDFVKVGPLELDVWVPDILNAQTDMPDDTYLLYKDSTGNMTMQVHHVNLDGAASLEEVEKHVVDAGGGLLQHDQPKEDHKQDKAGQAFFFVLHLVPDHRDAPKDQPDEQAGRGQGLGPQAPFDGVGQPDDADAHSDDVGEQGQDALFEFLENMGDAVDQGIENAHGDHHGPAADAGDDVGHADDDAPDNAEEGLFEFQSFRRLS